MDQMLRDVQSDLAPDREPRPPLDPEAPEAAIPDPPVPPPQPPVPDPALDAHLQIKTLTELSDHLIASMRELLDGYERVLALPERRSAHVTVSAGPFANIDALHEFEAALSHLRGVRDVVVRGYEGTDRAIIEVRLA
jgi:hypothetical protein